MMLGYPGAGKTFFARQYAEDQKLPIVSADRLRFELFEKPRFNKEEDSTITSLMDYMIEEYLRAGMSVIVDGLNSQRVRRHALREMCRKSKVYPLVVWVQTDLDTSFDRARARDKRQTDDKYTHSIDNDTFDKLRKMVKKPQHEDYTVLSGKHVYINQRNAMNRKVEAISKLKPKVLKPNKVSLGGRFDVERRKPRAR